MADVFIPKWKAGNGSAFMKNLERYLKYEVDLEQHEAAMRDAMARKENREMGSARVDGLGQLKATIPAREYFRWHQQERGCWGDRQFIKEWVRDNPDHKAKGNS
tara:strand:- start:2611 stop:2922 length:312 start_codon:yes stop_codon:yes gene_type:complete